MGRRNQEMNLDPIMVIQEQSHTTSWAYQMIEDPEMSQKMTGH